MRTARITLAVLAYSFTLMAADAFSGTWKLNVEKSTLLGRNADIASETLMVSETGPNTYTVVTDIVSKTGEKKHQEYKRTYDGKEHEVGNGGVEIDVRVDAMTHKVIDKKDGKQTGEFTITISTNGKLMTDRRSTGESRFMRNSRFPIQLPEHPLPLV
jgi:hypothetical protein